MREVQVARVSTGGPESHSLRRWAHGSCAKAGAAPISKASSTWVNLWTALRSLNSEYMWTLSFHQLALHKRPVAEFRVGVVLVSQLPPGSTYQLWPVPQRRRGPCGHRAPAAVPPRGDRGARVRGRGGRRGRGLRAARASEPLGAPLGDADDVQAIEDGALEAADGPGIMAIGADDGGAEIDGRDLGDESDEAMRPEGGSQSGEGSSGSSVGAEGTDSSDNDVEEDRLGVGRGGGERAMRAIAEHMWSLGPC